MALLPPLLLPSLASPKSIRAQVGSENAADDPSVRPPVRVSSLSFPFFLIRRRSISFIGIASL